jgi:hypothetical protein
LAAACQADAAAMDSHRMKEITVFARAVVTSFLGEPGLIFI